MFKRGTANGFRAEIPVGGHTHPSSVVGAKLLWKKAQKKAKKNKTSDVINKIIPQRIPLETNDVWKPRNVASRIMSRHHWIIVKIKIVKAINRIIGE